MAQTTTQVPNRLPLMMGIAIAVVALLAGAFAVWGRGRQTKTPEAQLRLVPAQVRTGDTTMTDKVGTATFALG